MTTSFITNTAAPALQNKGGNTGFRFKQFFVRHNRSSMKVGTDGVLIGCWSPIEPLAISHWPLACQQPTANGQRRILDIGTGSGLIALMLAQRTSKIPAVQIDAIDIDEASCLQAQENFNASPWAERLHAAHSSLQQWQTANGKGYDLIVSNPPYFVDSLKAPDAARCAARHNDTLPFGILMAESTRLLKQDGILAVIVPCDAEQELQDSAAAQGLQCIRRCYVHPKPGRAAKRVLLAWQKDTSGRKNATEHLTLEDENGGRSIEYRNLTEDFYLKI